MEKTQPLLEIRGLSVTFPTKRGEVQAINNMHLSVAPAGRLGLVGESGCGKSTVLLSILRLINRPGRITCGEILFKGKNMLQLSPGELRGIRGREITMIFQDPQTTLNPVFPVGEQIRESLRLHNIIPGTNLPWPFDLIRKKQEKERVLQAMQEVGIPSPMDRYASYPHQFSGGMQQRALIALALICEPALLLADEPTTALDVTIQAQILNLMLKINQDHHTAVILVTHDLGVAAEFCDTIAVMYAGRIVEQGAVDDVVTNPQHPYTGGLLSCRPAIGQEGQRIRPIPGNVPDIINLPPGCAFAPRCPLVRPICMQGPIPMLQIAENSFCRCLAQVNFERDSDWSWEHIIRICNE
jgi:oligopeptide/dipeptide ABC transporter ATP-binding protein